MACSNAPWQTSGAGQAFALEQLDGQSRATQGQRLGKSRASLSGFEMPVRIRQGSLQRTVDEHGPTGDPVRALQFVDGSQADTARRHGMSALTIRAATNRRPPKKANRHQVAGQTGKNAHQVSLCASLNINSRSSRDRADHA